MDSRNSLRSLNDAALLGRFDQLVKDDRRNAASLLRHVAEIDRRKLWARQGHPSMFDWCVVRFNMSESTAGKRIGAARTARRFPVLFDMVARGEIHLSGIHRLKAHLTDTNHRQVLDEAKFKSTRQIEKLVARLAPEQDAQSLIRKLPAPAPTPGKPRAPDAEAATAPASVPAAPAQTPLPQADLAAPPPPEPPRPAPPRSPDPRPLSPGRYKLQVTLDETAHDQLRQLQDLLAHQIPDGDPARIVQRALALLLAECRKRKAAFRRAKARSAAEEPSASGARADRAGARPSVPAELEREVWERDQGRCAFVGDDGRRCGETRCLEFAHIQPWAKGGEHSVENISLRCRAHNAYEAERDYGSRFIEFKRWQRRSMRVRDPAVARYNARADSGLAGSGAASPRRNRRTRSPRSTSPGEFVRIATPSCKVTSSTRCSSTQTCGSTSAARRRLSKHYGCWWRSPRRAPPELRTKWVAPEGRASRRACVLR